MRGIYFDALSLRLEIPQTPTDELAMIGNMAEFFDSSLELIPKGMTGYPLHARINLSEGSMIIRYGSIAHNMTLHVEAKGKGAELLRSFMLFHPALIWVCTRADICCDFVIPKPKAIDMRRFKNKNTIRPKHKYDGYWTLFESLSKEAKQKNIARETFGEGWFGGDGGRTFYIGSRGTVSRFRLYEKSEERWANGFKDYPVGVVRFEWQYRPTGQHRNAIIDIEPEHIISLNKTAIHLFEHVSGLEIDFRRIEGIEKLDDEVAFMHCLKQYSPTISRLAEKRGIRWVMRRALQVFDGERRKPDSQ